MDASVTDTLVVTISNQVSSLQDFGFTAFNAYPNPVENQLNISSETKIVSIEIVALNGAILIERTDIELGTDQINVGNLASGLYLLKAYTNDAVGVQSIIKR